MADRTVGALYAQSAGQVNVVKSTFERNQAESAYGALGIGGEIDSQGEYVGLVSVVQSTFLDNETGGWGGAIGTVTACKEFEIRDSVFKRNRSQGIGGGALFLCAPGGRYAIYNSWFEENEEGAESGGAGGAIYNGVPVPLEVNGSTIIRNHAQCDGGAILGILSGIKESLFENNSGNFNFVDDDSCGIIGSGNQMVTSPKLGPLRDNGGAVPTRKPRGNSPLVDAIDTYACYPYAVVEDARGVSRPQRKRCDIGAVGVGSARKR